MEKNTAWDLMLSDVTSTEVATGYFKTGVTAIHCRVNILDTE